MKAVIANTSDHAFLAPRNVLSSMLLTSQLADFKVKSGKRLVIGYIPLQPR